MNSFDPILGCVGFIILPTLFTWVTARWILGPISAAAAAGRHKTQYRIIDFFCLVVEIQAVSAVTVAVTRADEPQLRYPLVIFGTLAALALWVGGVQTLSRAGILDPRRRTVFNWVVLPAASVGALVFVPLVVWLLGTMSRPQREQSPGLWLLAVTLIGALFLSKGLAVWVLEEYERGLRKLARSNSGWNLAPVVTLEPFEDELAKVERLDVEELDLDEVALGYLQHDEITLEEELEEVEFDEPEVEVAEYVVPLEPPLPPSDEPPPTAS